MNNNCQLERVDIEKDQYTGWFMYMVYSYEDKKGKHRVIFPHVSFPILNSFDTPCCSIVSPYNGSVVSPYLPCNDMATLHKGEPKLRDIKGLAKRLDCELKPAYQFDFITEFTTHKMTLEEIEKELGYKVKVVSKEDK